MPPPKSSVCPDCRRFLANDGRCAACDGTGSNPRLNDPEPRCRACTGTGVCPTCKGRGRVLAKAAKGPGNAQLVSYLAIAVLAGLLASFPSELRPALLAIALYAAVRAVFYRRRKAK